MKVNYVRNMFLPPPWSSTFNRDKTVSGITVKQTDFTYQNTSTKLPNQVSHSMEGHELNLEYPDLTHLRFVVMFSSI